MFGGAVHVAGESGREAAAVVRQGDWGVEA